SRSRPDHKLDPGTPHTVRLMSARCSWSHTAKATRCSAVWPGERLSLRGRQDSPRRTPRMANVLWPGVAPRWQAYTWACRLTHTPLHAKDTDAPWSAPP